MLELKHILSDNYNALKHFGVNQLIFKEGQKIEGVFFIKNGRVKVTRSGKNNVALWFANPNEFIGLSSFFNNSDSYSFSTHAFGGDVEMILIPVKEFNQLLKQYPAFKQEIIKILCHRISYTRKRIGNIKTQNIKKRFLNAIWMFVDEEAGYEKTVKIACSVEEFSELTGSSRQYIQKLIKAFCETQLIEQVTENFIVVNVDELLKTQLR